MTSEDFRTPSNNPADRESPKSFYSSENGRDSESRLSFPSINYSPSQISLANTEERSRNEEINRENIMKKFIGRFLKISGNEGHQLELKLEAQGVKLNLYLKLSNDDEGHFANMVQHNIYKFYCRHSFGYAAFTMDNTKKYLMEENLTEGKNWIWKLQEPIDSDSTRLDSPGFIYNYLS